VSSLKDWYQYVDSKARGRADSSTPPDAASGSGEAPASQDPGEAAPSSGSDEVPSPAGAVAAGEEGLDIWSGLFTPRRKPEPPPATGPLKRPAVRLDEVPAHLLAQAPLESPPAPQFSLPESNVEIPAFDAFIAPSSEPAPSPSAASSPSAAASGEAPNGPVTSPTAVHQPRPSDHSDTSPPAAEGAAETSPAAAVASELPPSATTPDAETADADGTSTSEGQPEGDEEQSAWRSSFHRPGPGRTISSGASVLRPEPLPPRSNETQPRETFYRRDLSPSPETRRGSGQEETGDRDASPRLSADPLPRPAPGTEAWERERVERLARTFRETLQALEQTLADPGAKGVSPAPRSASAPGAPSSIRPPVPARPVEAATEDERPAVAEPAARLEGETPVQSTDAPASTAEPEPVLAAPPAAAPIETAATADESAVRVRPGAGPRRLQISARQVRAAAGRAQTALPLSVAAAADAAAIAQGFEAPALQVPVTPTLSTAAQIPDVAPAELALVERPPSAAGIEEAALIRERLPQHMAMMLRIPTNEVAQNSYKSPFRETREDLIGRLLDPQLTLEEAARILGVCPTTVRRYTNREMLHCHRTPGNQRRFRMSDVLQFLEQHGDRIDRAAEARHFEEAA
jgi:excisionase family DNA binding protein